MSALRRSTLVAAALAALAVPTPGHALQQTVMTGYNDGSEGSLHLLYGVNVPVAQQRDGGPPRTFGLMGQCNYVPGSGFDVDHVAIAVEGHAAAAPSWDLAAAISTSVLCEVVGSSGTVLATGATAGGTTAAAGLGEVSLDDLGTLELCLTVNARFTDTSLATTGRVCAPPTGILAEA